MLISYCQRSNLIYQIFSRKAFLLHLTCYLKILSTLRSKCFLVVLIWYSPLTKLRAGRDSVWKISLANQSGLLFLHFLLSFFFFLSFRFYLFLFLLSFRYFSFVIFLSFSFSFSFSRFLFTSFFSLFLYFPSVILFSIYLASVYFFPWIFIFSSFPSNPMWTYNLEQHFSCTQLYSTFNLHACTVEVYAFYFYRN